MSRPKLFRISTVPTSIETFCKGQLKMLSQYFEVVAVSSPEKELEIVGKRECVRTVAIPMERHISVFKDFLSLMRMIWLFMEEKPTIVHSMTPKAGLVSMIAAWITRVPVRMHTYTGLVFPTATGMTQKILILMDRILCFCATYINPEGEGVKRDLQRFHITKKPLHIIANGNVRGIDLEYYCRTEDVMAKAADIRDEKMFTFCFVGRVVGDKGINELVAAFDRLSKQSPNLRLILVGPMEAELDPLSPSTIDIIKNNSQIIFSGAQTDVRPFMAASDALVFPSYREGFPNVVLETGAMGLPSIVTNINGCNEIIIEGKNGVIIPPRDENALYDAMKHFVEHPDAVKGMAVNAREMIASRYEQKMIWQALLAEYQKQLQSV
jgi:glycosyltransferase involved in cell wall biosynthesis